MAPAGSAAAASASAKPVAGGTLRLGQVGDLTTVDPSFSSSPVESIYAAHDRLTQYDLKHQPQPMLAQSWDLTPDYKQVTFHLRSGVMFHTGREMTSDDVKFNVVRE